MSKQQALQQVLCSVLSDGHHQLVFRKSDGTHREMIATRDPVLIDVAQRSKDAFTPATAAEHSSSSTRGALTVVVFDLVENDWRSFRIDRLVAINGTGLATLAALVNCTVADLEMTAASTDRYVTPGRVGYLDYKAAEQIVENSDRLEKVAESFGVRTWFVTESEF